MNAANKSQVGVFTSAGHNLTFKSGVWKGLVEGKWYKTTDKYHLWEIALTTLKSGFTSMYCDYEKQ